MRLVCPSDLPGDNNNPNSPDYVEPLYERADAVEYVVDKLVAADILNALIIDVADAAFALRMYVAGRTHLPKQEELQIMRLLQQASRLNGLLEDECDRLNEGARYYE